MMLIELNHTKHIPLVGSAGLGAVTRTTPSPRHCPLLRSPRFSCFRANHCCIARLLATYAFQPEYARASGGVFTRR
jgi:hypothetical protein